MRSVVFPNPGPSPGPIVLASSNINRVGLYLVNNSPTATLYIALETVGTTPIVSPTSYTLILPPTGSYVMPYPAFTGEVHGFWSPVAALDNVQVTDLGG